MNLLHEYPLGDEAPKAFNVIIEINKGSGNKYELDKKTGLIKLDRVFRTAQVMPFDYGFAPQTWWHDGDPLDVMVLTTYPLMPGVVVEVRPVGIMEMNDSGEVDHKIIAVPVDDARWDNVQDIQDVNEHFKKEVTHFYETYKMLQNKVVKVGEWKDRAAAEAAVVEAQELYKKEFSK